MALSAMSAGLIDTLFGPASVTVGQEATYSYDSDVLLSPLEWDISNGTKVSSSSSGSSASGYIYKVIVKWSSSPGTGSITLRSNAQNIATKTVSIESQTPPPCNLQQPTVSDVGRCGPGHVNITATPATEGTNVRWYTSISGGSPVYTGTQYALDVTQDRFLYVATFNNTCESTSRKAVRVFVDQVPLPPIVDQNHQQCYAEVLRLDALPGTGGNTLRWYTSATEGNPLFEGESYTPATMVSQTFYVSSFNDITGCESVSRVLLTAVIPAAPTVWGGKRFDAGRVILYSDPASNWYAPNDSLLAEYSDLYVTPTLDRSKVHYLYVTKIDPETACPSNKVWVDVSIFKTPVITAATSFLTPGSALNLQVNDEYDDYTWKDIEGNPVGGNLSQCPVNVAGGYYVTVTKEGLTRTSDPFQVLVLNQVESNTVIRAGVHDVNEIIYLDVRERSQTVQYIDGLGRTLQSVITQGSFQRKDVVQPSVYDVFGRPYRSYLPVVPNTRDGLYKVGLLDSQGNYSGVGLNFYNNGEADFIADDKKPYTEALFEPSPLNRVIGQGAAGESWQPDTLSTYATPVENDHSIKKAYVFNRTAEVILFNYDESSKRISLGSANYYAAGQLQVNRTKDEHNHEMVEYVDKESRTILKKVETVDENGATVFAETYYIYDDLGNLVMVLPPEAMRRIKSTLIPQP